MGAKELDTVLWPLPADGVTRLRFSDHSDRLLVASWDSVSTAASLLCGSVDGVSFDSGPVVVVDCGGRR